MILLCIGVPRVVMIWLNGKQVDCLPLPHRALAYGDGLFETIRIDKGVARLLDRHLLRLTSSAMTLNFTLQDALVEISDKTANILHTMGNTASGVLKIILLRSHQGRGYRPTMGNSFDLIHEFYPADDLELGWKMKGINIGCCQSSVSVNSLLAGHKHLNRLDSVMAANECDINGWDDGVLFANDRVVEATSANIFIIKEDNLLTPKIDQAGVKGVTRDLILEEANNCFHGVLEKDLYVNDLLSADFIFITNAVIIARPVSKLIFEGEARLFNSQHSLFNALTNLLSGVLER